MIQLKTIFSSIPNQIESHRIDSILFHRGIVLQTLLHFRIPCISGAPVKNISTSHHLCVYVNGHAYAHACYIDIKQTSSLATVDLVQTSSENTRNGFRSGFTSWNLDTSASCLSMCFCLWFETIPQKRKQVPKQLEVQFMFTNNDILWYF